MSPIVVGVVAVSLLGTATIMAFLGLYLLKRFRRRSRFFTLESDSALVSPTGQLVAARSGLVPDHRAQQALLVVAGQGDLESGYHSRSPSSSPSQSRSHSHSHPHSHSQSRSHSHARPDTRGSIMSRFSHDLTDPNLLSVIPFGAPPSPDSKHLPSDQDLPAYSKDPSSAERTVAKEGERGGIDNIVNFPWSAEEAERERDRQMESLFRIRESRRTERAIRERYLPQIEDAQQRRDHFTLAQIRAARERDLRDAGMRPSADLIAEHRQAINLNQPPITSVAYADIGLVRHNGSKIKTNPTEEDLQPTTYAEGCRRKASMGSVVSYDPIRGRPRSRTVTSSSIFQERQHSEPAPVPASRSESRSESELGSLTREGEPADAPVASSLLSFPRRARRQTIGSPTELTGLLSHQESVRDSVREAARDPDQPAGPPEYENPPWSASMFGPVQPGRASIGAIISPAADSPTRARFSEIRNEVERVADPLYGRQVSAAIS